jgi:hypothetical protein
MSLGFKFSPIKYPLKVLSSKSFLELSSYFATLDLFRYGRLVFTSINEIEHNQLLAQKIVANHMVPWSTSK